MFNNDHERRRTRCRRTCWWWRPSPRGTWPSAPLPMSFLTYRQDLKKIQQNPPLLEKEKNEENEKSFQSVDFSSAADQDPHYFWKLGPDPYLDPSFQPSSKVSKPWKSAQIGSYSIHFGLSSANWCGSWSRLSLWYVCGSSLSLWCGSGSGSGSYLSIWCGSMQVRIHNPAQATSSRSRFCCVGGGGGGGGKHKY